MANDKIMYRNFNIYYDPPPIPVRNCDWHAVHDSYDGAEDAYDNRYYHGPSLDDVTMQVDMYYEEQIDTSLLARVMGVLDFATKHLTGANAQVVMDHEVIKEVNQVLSSSIGTNLQFVELRAKEALKKAPAPDTIRARRGPDDLDETSEE